MFMTTTSACLAILFNLLLKPLGVQMKDAKQKVLGRFFRRKEKTCNFLGYTRSSHSKNTENLIALKIVRSS